MQRATAWSCHGFDASKKSGPCRPFVFVMCRMYHCHLNVALHNGGMWEMDETGCWSRNQSPSLRRMMEEVTMWRVVGGCLDICVTQEHDRKLAEMKKNRLAFEGVLDEFSSTQHVGRGNRRTNLWSWWFPSTQFTVLKSDTLILISIWSLPTSCLMLIAIRVTRAHTGDYLITLVLLVPINNPSRAIIHVAILINTIMRTAAKLDLDEVSSSLRGSFFFFF